MKNLIFISYIFLFLLSTTSLIAQPDWQWGQEVRFNAQNITTDNIGNSYVTWSLQDNYEIDGELFISHGGADVALTSFDCDGAHRWTKIIGGLSGDQAAGLGTDTLGGVYVSSNANAGRLLNYSINIDTDTTIISNRQSMLLIKYNTEGDFQWVRMPEDTVILNFPDDLQLGAAFEMDVAPSGDCYVYSRLFPGTYGDGAFEATYDATLQEGEDIYGLKYNSSGNCTGGVHFDIFYTEGSLASFRQTRDHYTGWFYMSDNLDSDDIVIFGGEQVTANNYIVQFDSSGFVNWRVSAVDIAISNTRFFGKPSIDEYGNVYVTGGSRSENSLGDFTFQNTFGPSTVPIFAKVDSSGNVVYATNASVNNANNGRATAYSNNKIGVTGQWSSLLSWGDIVVDSSAGDSQGYNVFLAFFDPLGDGTPESFHNLASSPLGVEDPTLLTSDTQGNFYVGGNFSGQLHVGDGTLYNQTGTQEGFIAKFGTDSCYCPLPEALFTYDSIPNEAGYYFGYTGSTDADSVNWDFGDGQTASGFNPYHFFAESGIYTVCATAFNQCGANSFCFDIDALGPVGIKAINGFEEIRLYPNPANEAVYIDNALPGTRIDVINAVGQQLGSSILQSNNAKINVSSLPPGVYLLQLTGSDGKRGYARFVKE